MRNNSAGMRTVEELLEANWSTSLSETVARCLLKRSNEAILALLGKLGRMVERHLSNVSSGLSELDETAVDGELEQVKNN